MDDPVNTINIFVIHTISYSSLIIQKNTLSYSIFHNLKSIQMCSQIQFSYAIQFNSSNQFSYALNEFNLCHRYTGYKSHRHGLAGLQAGKKNGFITQYDPAGLLTGYKKSFSEHYRYGPAGLLIGVTHQYNRSQYCYLTPIGIPIYP